eukprot:5305860-Pyramimonas_sp.AAC.1
MVDDNGEHGRGDVRPASPEKGAASVRRPVPILNIRLWSNIEFRRADRRGLTVKSVAGMSRPVSPQRPACRWRCGTRS